MIVVSGGHRRLSRRRFERRFTSSTSVLTSVQRPCHVTESAFFACTDSLTMILLEPSEEETLERRCETANLGRAWQVAGEPACHQPARLADHWALLLLQSLVDHSSS